MESTTTNVSPTPAAPAAPAVAPAAPITTDLANGISLNENEQLEALAAARAAKAERYAAQQRESQQQPSQKNAQNADTTVEQEQQQSVESFELAVPEWVDPKVVSESHQTWLGDFQNIAPTSGIDARTAQDILEIAVDGAVHVGDHGIDIENSTPEEGRIAMERTFGAEAAKGLIENAQRYVKAHGGKDGPLATWLTETGLGNAPEIVTALAFASSAYFKLSPEKAQGEIDKIMQTKEYGQGSKLAVLKLQALSRVANRNSQSLEDQLNSAARAKASAPAVPAVAPADRSKLEAESKDLSRKAFNGSMTSAEKARFMELTKRISS
jgi:hypothetical protein